jgi:hypothetical protein
LLIDWWAEIWDSASLMGQCKSEHQDFKKAKERTWDSASLKAKTFKRD